MKRRTVLGVVIARRDHAEEYRRRLERDPSYFQRLERAFVGGLVPKPIALALEQEKRRRGVTAVSIITKALKKELFK